MVTSWLAVTLSLLCLAATTRAWDAAAASLKLRANPLLDPRLTKRDYIATSFRPDNQTAAFYVDVLVGTPPQFFSLALSTDSATWLPSPRNKNATRFCEQKSTGNTYWSCFYDHFFDPSASSTFQKQAGELSRKYGTGIFAEGTWGSDVFKINQLSISNVSFGLASNWTTGGKIGLGVGFDKAGSPYPTIPEAMAASNDINLVLYSVYINDIRNDGGDLYFGAVDSAKYNGTLKSWRNYEVSQIPVTGVYWIAPNGTNSSLTSGLMRSNAVGELQLGTPSLWLPNSVYSALINSIPDLRYSPSYEAYTLDCQSANSDMGTLQFDIDGVMISIEVRQILLEYPPGSGFCVFTAYQNEDAGLRGPDYLLGTPFLRSAYSVFDFTNNRTSIAPSIANSTDSQLREVPSGGIAALAIQTSTPPTSTDNPTTSSTAPAPPITAASSPSKTNIGAIVGGTIGGVALIAAGVLTWLFVKRRRRQSQTDMPQPPMQDSGHDSTYPPPQAASYGGAPGPTAPGPQTHPYGYAPLPYKPPDPPAGQTTQHAYGYPNNYPAGTTTNHGPSSYHENWGVANGPPATGGSGNGNERSGSMVSGSSATYAQDLSSFSGGPGMSPPLNPYGGYEHNSYNSYERYGSHRSS
ncbi:Barrierpepsin [Drechslerella dactyloides]|uniref:Barrierpepsin n=1 Tax=Drechslerella dactyloides TaxID=74499 RepID=A0AAD6IUJ0_DREDA|nr:Barrierpepsin [Drechslerella dactyloides]